jgi:hypothetical protein
MNKKVANAEQIQTVKSSLYYKIFDILKTDDTTYYLDNELSLIWDEKKDVIGIIDKGKYIFFKEIDDIIRNIKKENII